jgi:hypothetical protein
MLAGESDPVVAMTRMAADLLDEVGLPGPPFSPHILASFRGIREIRLAEMSSAARLVPDDGGLLIELNQAHSSGKRNFSADHEIAHTLMPSYSYGFVDDAETGTFSSSSEEEYLCDVGAAAMLLDPRTLKTLATEMGPSLETILMLADLFDASLEATVRAISNCNLWPCAFVFWEEGFRKSERASQVQPMLQGFVGFGAPEPKLRVSRVYRTSSFPHYIPPNKSVPRSSLVALSVGLDEPTFGIEGLDLGHEEISIYCENLHVPYRTRGEYRSRVLSVLLPVMDTQRSNSFNLQYALEVE